MAPQIDRSVLGILQVDPRIGGTAALSRTLNDGPAGFAGRVIANIDVVMAHDCYPLLK